MFYRFYSLRASSPFLSFSGELLASTHSDSMGEIVNASLYILISSLCMISTYLITNFCNDLYSWHAYSSFVLDIAKYWCFNTLRSVPQLLSNITFIRFKALFAFAYGSFMCSCQFSLLYQVMPKNFAFSFCWIFPCSF